MVNFKEKNIEDIPTTQTNDKNEEFTCDRTLNFLRMIMKSTNTRVWIMVGDRVMSQTITSYFEETF